LTNKVRISAIPPDQRQQMADELARVRVVVLLSEFETQPLAALEALALGCGLIVADVPGLRDLVDRGWARSVPLDSPPEEVAAAILEQLELPRNSTAPKLPTWDECADSLYDLYQSVVRARRAQSHDRSALMRSAG
jgi:glycosyltransferase involved in cell wall biosynthesis